MLEEVQKSPADSESSARQFQIMQLISESISELNETLDTKVNLSQGMGSPLFGGDGVLDSMALVTLIVMVEEKVALVFGSSLILASEKAMSRRRSPFATVGSLVNYVDGLLAEEGTSK